jgi:hypothetical protein
MGSTVVSGLRVSGCRHAAANLLLSLVSPAPRHCPVGPATAQSRRSVGRARIACAPSSSPIHSSPVRRAPPTAVGAAWSRRVHVVLVHVTKPRPPLLCCSSTQHRTWDPHSSLASFVSTSKGAGRRARSLLFSPPLTLLRPQPRERHMLPSFSRL